MHVLITLDLYLLKGRLSGLKKLEIDTLISIGYRRLVGDSFGHAVV